MKKIIFGTILTFLFVSGIYSVFASSHMFMKDTLGMKDDTSMMNMISPEIQKKQMALMKKIKSVLGQEKAHEVDAMRKKHMKDMQEFMKQFPMTDMSKEKMEARKAMKEKHFADLKELLKKYPKAYKEISSEMEQVMQEAMMNMKKTSSKMGHEKSLPVWQKMKIDRTLKTFITKIGRLDDDEEMKKVQSVFDKIDSLLMKAKTSNTKMILRYIANELSIKSGLMKKTMSSMDHGDVFDNDITGLPEAKPSELVILKDGDTYAMEAGAVKQKVGNRIIKRLAYNGMIPGPLIRVEKGSTVNIVFTNNLEIETTMHPHGIRLNDSRFDGLPTTMGGEQKPMQPGETFTYTLNFDDVGVFWYHPHIREDYTQELGLYGNYHVTEKGYWNDVAKEEFLILDDFAEDDFYKDKVNKTLMGRFGEIMMINNDEDYTLKLKTGEKARLFLTNVANTRTFDFAIVDQHGKQQKLKLVGGDIGRIEKEVIIDSQIIAPAERYIVEVVFNKPGSYTITSKERGLGEIIVNGNPTNISMGKLRENPDDYKIIRDRFEEFVNKKADKRLRLDISMEKMKSMGMMDMGNNEMSMGGDKTHMPRKGNLLDTSLEHGDDSIEREDTMAMMNAMSDENNTEWSLIDDDTGKKNMDIQRKFKQGDLVKIEIYNDPDSPHPMQHPIHFHGQRFVVLSRNGVLNDNLQRKDTVLIKTGEKIEILVEMSNPGTWMSHCHIAEHLQDGMMMVFEVEEEISKD